MSDITTGFVGSMSDTSIMAPISLNERDLKILYNTELKILETMKKHINWKYNILMTPILLGQSYRVNSIGALIGIPDCIEYLKESI